MRSAKDFNFSYWERKTYFKQFDLIIIGSGIVGLSTAISFKEKNRKASVLILERGILPNGASTKNAGFACFGSPGELLGDLDKMPAETVWETVQMRWQGLRLLRKRLKDKNIDFKSFGNFELFDDKKKYLKCLEKITYLNQEVFVTLGLKNCYGNAPEKIKQFKNVKGILVNHFEGQIDTGLMMSNLTILARKHGIEILNNSTVLEINDLSHSIELTCGFGVLKAKKVVVATNGFAKQLLNIKGVEPARAQVLITKPIPNLKIKGAFHFEQGFYYFRNVDNRILLGGGRNLDFKGETTHQQGLNVTIQKELDRLLKEIILPRTSYEIEQRWSGIMGVGNEKKPIIKLISKNVLAAVRMGGMGIAIGSWVGEKAANEIK